MKRKTITTIILLHLTGLVLFSAEIDQITDRHKYQNSAVDFTEKLNNYTNEMLLSAVAAFNRDYETSEMTDEEIHRFLAFEIFKSTAADERERYRENIPERVHLIYALGKSGHGPIQRWIQSDANNGLWTRLDENIYSDLYPDPLNQNYIIKVGGEFIGPDKIDHFFDQGYSYWMKSEFGTAHKRAIEFGVESELGWYGLKAGGVFSFADLRANWGGYQFYIHLFDKETGNFSLQDDGTVLLHRNFDWNEHIDWQFDELKNPCFLTKNNMNRVCRYIEENYDEYFETFQFLEKQKIFEYIDQREDFYITDDIVYDDSVYFDMRLIMSES